MIKIFFVKIKSKLMNLFNCHEQNGKGYYHNTQESIQPVINRTNPVTIIRIFEITYQDEMVN